jgi:glycosyltransferase involved in cell wall biosynthesis
LNDRSSPEISVVIVTDRNETIRRTMRHLRAQTVRDRLEIVIVAPSAELLDLHDADFEGFHRVRVVEVSTIRSLSRARAPGVRHASAATVAFVESHSYPDPGWAEALIEAHRQPWAAVGPVIGNANPGGMISWSNLLLDYGPWLEPAAGGVIDDLPGHNSSYKRAILLDYDDELEDLLEAEGMLHRDMRARGYRLYLEPGARISHLNISLPSSWIPERYYAARGFAGARARFWSPFRRCLYVGGAPLIPLVRLLRILRDIRRSGRQRQLLPWVLPALVAGLIVSAVGEMVGYALGVGKAVERASHLELYKAAYVTKQERQIGLSP